MTGVGCGPSPARSRPGLAFFGCHAAQDGVLYENVDESLNVVDLTMVESLFACVWTNA